MDRLQWNSTQSLCSVLPSDSDFSSAHQSPFSLMKYLLSKKTVQHFLEYFFPDFHDVLYFHVLRSDIFVHAVTSRANHGSMISMGGMAEAWQCQGIIAVHPK